MNPVPTIAERINAWLTPDRRKFLHGAVGLVGAILVLWGVVSPDVANLWVAVVLAVGGLGSTILASIMARRADVTKLYAAAAVLLAALVAARVVFPDLAQHIDQTMALLVAFFGSYAYTRTDPATPLGDPLAEAVAAGV